MLRLFDWANGFKMIDRRICVWCSWILGVEKLDILLFLGPLGLDVIPGFEINGSFLLLFCHFWLSKSEIVSPNRV